MAYTQLKPRHTKGARVEEIARESLHYLLSIPSGKADRYRLSQLDDYTKIKRGDFPHRPPVSLSLSARTSIEFIPGTWGFGLWNDPFGLSPGFGGSPFRLPALPNAVWFFGASQESYLSFQDNRASSTNGATYAPPSAQRERYVANGFLAQTFRSPKFHARLIPAGLAFPFSRRTTRRMLGQIIKDDGLQLWSPTARRQNQEQVSPLRHGDAPALHSVDVTQWHRYKLDWREKRVSFEVDDALVFESPVSPHPPLGLVIWIDNQFAAFTPEGQIGFGVLENREPAWLEVKDIEVK